MRVRFPSPAPRKSHSMIIFRFTVRSIEAFRLAWQYYSVLSYLNSIFEPSNACAEDRLEPYFLPKMQAPLGWSCRLDFPIARPAGPPPHRYLPNRRPADCHQMPPTGRQRPPDPVASLFKQDLRTQLRWRERPPAVDLNSKGPRGRPRRARNGGRARRRSATGLLAPSAQKTCRPQSLRSRNGAPPG
jgi:hypothetical protein